MIGELLVYRYRLITSSASQGSIAAWARCLCRWASSLRGTSRKRWTTSATGGTHGRRPTSRAVTKKSRAVRSGLRTRCRCRAPVLSEHSSVPRSAPKAASRAPYTHSVFLLLGWKVWDAGKEQENVLGSETSLQGCHRCPVAI